MSANGPVVSAVVPAYNAAALIRKTLDSVLGQTLADIEVIVVDDGSVDATRAIAQGFAARDPRVRLIVQDNAGVGAARNTALRQARGRYVAPIDSDDLWAPDKLEKQLALMERHGDATGLVYCWSSQIDQAGRYLGENPPYTIEGRVPKALIARNFVGNSSVPLFRATTLADVGGYLTRAEQGGGQGCEDWDLGLRIAERYDVRVVPQRLVQYRQLTSGMSFQDESMRRSYAMILERVRARNPSVPRSLLRWSAGRFYQYLASQAHTKGDYVGSIRNFARAVSVDPVALLNVRSQKRLARSVAGLLRGRPPTTTPIPIDGSSEARAGVAPSASRRRSWVGNALYEGIESRRWAAVQG